MRKSNSLLQGTMILLTGRIAGYFLSFVRNVILARTLGKADFGLAAAFSMAITLLELSGNMCFGLQVVQSKKGEEPAFLGTAQALQFIGGSCSALMLVALSYPIAKFLGVPGTWWAFALLASVPMCQGLGHMDVSRRQRHLEYLPLILSDVVPQLLITAAAWPLAHWLGDFRVIVILMLTKAATGTIITFLCATRPYVWAWQRDYIKSMLAFGWPLLLTGFITFGSQQADQIIIGSVFSLDLLASYGLAFSMISIPWFIFSQVSGSLMLPLLSRLQDDLERLKHQYRLCIQIAAVCAGLFLVPMIVAGEQLVTLIFGGKYVGTGAFVAILGSAMAFRFLRLASGNAAAARADTINQFYSNLWRAAGLPIALAVVALKGTPTQIAACAIVGEILATVYSLYRLRQKQQVPLRESSVATVYLVGILVLNVGYAHYFASSLGIVGAAVSALASLGIAVGIARIIFPEVAQVIYNAIMPRLATKTAAL
ncbi:MAG: oligosaccharide flippase family protein [Nibricoccus sp.]